MRLGSTKQENVVYSPSQVLLVMARYQAPQDLRTAHTNKVLCASAQDWSKVMTVRKRKTHGRVTPFTRYITHQMFKSDKSKPRICMYMLRDSQYRLTGKRCQQKPTVETNGEAWLCTRHYNQLYEAGRVIRK